MLLGRMLCTVPPEISVESSFLLRTIVSKYGCAFAVLYCVLNFCNIYMDAVHLS